MRRETYFLMAIALALVAFNGYMIYSMSSHGSSIYGAPLRKSADITKVSGTAMSLATVFDLSRIKTQEDAMNVLMPKGTPEYGQELGISYDDPVGSLEKLAGMWEPYSRKVRQENPDVWNRFMALASKPVGISCEFCCGVGAVGIDSNGNSICGCQHNPALLSITLWLMENTDMTDQEVLAEALRWKTLFFPRDMISLATGSADGLSQMVGGC